MSYEAPPKSKKPYIHVYMDQGAEGDYHRGQKVRHVILRASALHELITWPSEHVMIT